LILGTVAALGDIHTEDVLLESAIQSTTRGRNLRQLFSRQSIFRRYKHALRFTVDTQGVDRTASNTGDTSGEVWNGVDLAATTEADLAMPADVTEPSSGPLPLGENFFEQTPLTEEPSAMKHSQQKKSQQKKSQQKKSQQKKS